MPGSPDSTFYLLEPHLPEQAQPRPNTVPVMVGTVRLPLELERSELVRYRSGGGLELLETSRWAAPLDAMVARTLALDLAARLERVVLPGQRTSPRAEQQTLNVLIERFGAGPGDALTLTARWTLADDDRGTRLARRTRIEVDLAGSGPAAIPAAMSAALARLADEVAATVAAP
ncbi:MAG: PqiC family protein [Pseudomonadota bacterium]